MALNTADCYNHHKQSEKYQIVNDASGKSFKTYLWGPELGTLTVSVMAEFIYNIVIRK